MKMIPYIPCNLNMSVRIPDEAFKKQESISMTHISRGMGFQTMWYERPPKPQISLRIRPV